MKPAARAFSTALTAVALSMAMATGAFAQTENILHTFTGGADGGNPNSSLILDGKGNLYGTTSGGGTSQNCTGCGTVFEFARGSNGTWTQNVLYNSGSMSNFADGLGPQGRLTFDSKGNLYGTTVGGGSSFQGTVFELSPGSNGTWTETVLYNFTGGSNGANPFNGVVLDSTGNLYGTASGGASGFGLIFELVAGTNGTLTYKILYNFTGNNDGAYPYGTLLFDQAGNIYGVCPQGGTHDYGLVFRLTAGSNGKWKEKVLHVFPGGSAGSNPIGGLVWDSAGNLFGVASYIAYELSSSNGTWTEKTLHSFGGGSDGASPQAALAIDKAGNLYGMTYSGGAHRGTVYELSPSSNGKWSEKILHNFAGDGVDGVFPSGAAVAIDSSGNIFGTTVQGGASKFGVLFEIVP